jgi:hypothetical protein
LADHFDLAKNFYNAARAEIVSRLTMRDQTFAAWLGVAGAILAFSAKSAGAGSAIDPNVLLIIPILSCPFSLAVLRHQWIINKLGLYIRTELDRIFDTPDEKDLHTEALG